jgi:hypothetical protein
VFHRADAEDRLLILSDGGLSEAFSEPRGHRAIGVVYDPGREALGNYVPTVLTRRYDAFLYLDQTEALRPLHLREREEREVPETFPTGI